MKTNYLFCKHRNILAERRWRTYIPTNSTRLARCASRQFTFFKNQSEQWKERMAVTQKKHSRLHGYAARVTRSLSFRTFMLTKFIWSPFMGNVKRRWHFWQRFTANSQLELKAELRFIVDICSRVDDKSSIGEMIWAYNKRCDFAVKIIMLSDFYLPID